MPTGNFLDALAALAALPPMRPLTTPLPLDRSAAPSAPTGSVGAPELVLDASRLALEPQVVAHADGLFAALSDPAIYRYEGSPPGSVESLQARLQALEWRRSPDGRERWFNWVIRLPDQQVAGYVQATLGGPGYGEATIAYVLSSRYWGRGIATAAVRAMIDELASHHQVHTLWAVYKQANLRSQRLLERMGFEPTTLRPQAILEVEADECLVCRPAVLR